MSAGFADYASLQASIATWLSRTGDPELVPRIPDFIFLAEVRIERETDWPHHELVETGVVAPGAMFVALPDDLSWPLSFELDEHPVNVVSAAEMVRLREFGTPAVARAGVVRSVTLVGTPSGLTFELAPSPAAGGAWRLRYMGGLPKLSDARTTNWLLETGPDALLYGALMHAAPFLHDDERVGLWEKGFRDGVRSLKKVAFRQRSGGGPLRIRPDRWA